MPQSARRLRGHGLGDGSFSESMANSTKRLDQLHQAAKLDPTLAQLFNSLGMVAFGQRRFDQALEAFSRGPAATLVCRGPY